MNYLGLDVGGTKIAAVVMDEQGREWGRYRCATRKENRQAFISCIVDFVADIRARTGTPMAIGIALPGSVSPQHGAIRNANIQVINGYRLQDALEQALGQPVVLAQRWQLFRLIRSMRWRRRRVFIGFRHDVRDRLRRWYYPGAAAFRRRLRYCRRVWAYRLARLFS